MKKIILDTDIGGDPDDLIALILALKSNEIEIKTILTSDEYKGQRALFAKKIIDQFDFNILVFCGSDLGNDKCFVVPTEDNKPLENNFIPYIRELIQKTEEIIYLCIGPQSNLAKVIKEIPEAKQKLKLYIMGGNFSTQNIGKSEHNIRYDIKSAQQVIQSGFEQNWITAEMTYDERLCIEPNNALHKKICETKQLQNVAENCELFWKKLYPKNYLHDPIALSTIFTTEIINFEKKKVNIDDQGILYETSTGSEVNISTAFNIDPFLKLLERIFV